MEGISSIVHSDQTTSGTAKFAAGRKWMAQDVNAAAEMATMLTEVKRVDGRTVAFTADDYIEGFRTLRALISITPAR